MFANVLRIKVERGEQTSRKAGPGTGNRDFFGVCSSSHVVVYRPLPATNYCICIAITLIISIIQTLAGLSGWQWHRATTVTWLGNRLDGTLTSFRSSIRMSQLSGDSTASADATLASLASSVDKCQTYRTPRFQHPAFSFYSSQAAVLWMEVTRNRRSAEVA